jgi:hypothetical protein
MLTHIGLVFGFFLFVSFFVVSVHGHDFPLDILKLVLFSSFNDSLFQNVVES